MSCSLRNRIFVKEILASYRSFTAKQSNISRFHSTQCSLLLSYSMKYNSNRIVQVPCFRPFMLTSSIRQFSSDIATDDSKEQCIFINWKKNGQIIRSKVKVGSTILSASRQSHGVDIEGACDGVCACSTCHVILDSNVYDSLPAASEEEEDMLDQAYGLTSSSRLGCQVVLTLNHNDLLVTLPKATRNFYVDGHVPKHH